MLPVAGSPSPELLDRELPLPHPIGQVVDDADGRVRQAELPGDHALGGDRHADHVRMPRDEPDLRAGLESGTDGLPIDTAVANGSGGAPRPGLQYLPPPAGLEPRHHMRAPIVEG